MGRSAIFLTEERFLLSYCSIFMMFEAYPMLRRQTFLGISYHKDLKISWKIENCHPLILKALSHMNTRVTPDFKSTPPSKFYSAQSVNVALFFDSVPNPEMRSPLMRYILIFLDSNRVDSKPLRGDAKHCNWRGVSVSSRLHQRWCSRDAAADGRLSSCNQSIRQWPTAAGRRAGLT